MSGTLLDVANLRIGHHTYAEGRTGCSVILCGGGAIAGIDLRGSPLGTNEIDLVRTGALVKRINAVLLTGGSVFGLQAVRGVMRYLEERHMGFELQDMVVPIVPALSIFDLDVATTRPDEFAAYDACVAARGDCFPEGAVGVATGAYVAKHLGIQHASKSKLGTASARLGDRTISALAVANCTGWITNPSTGAILAGSQHADSDAREFNTVEFLARSSNLSPVTSNVMAVVATDAPLDSQQATMLAATAQGGFTRTIHPMDSTITTSTVIVLSTAFVTTFASPEMLQGMGAIAVDVIADAVLDAISERE